MRKVLIVSLTLFTVVLFIGCKPKVSVDPSKANKEMYYLSSREPPQNWKEYPDIEAIELVTKYKEDPETAALEYDEKYFNITGALETAGDDDIGRPYIILGKAGGDGFNAVTFIFPENDRIMLSKLKAGNVYSVFGRVHDYLMNVIVYDCYLNGASELKSDK